MLVRYKKHYQKIAMGLLSFMPTEKDLQKLLTTISQYETEQKRQLFLWKEEESIIGLMGVLVSENQVELQHISVNPSHRDNGYGKRMVDSLKNVFPDLPIIPNENTVSFMNKCNLNQPFLKESNQFLVI